MTYLSNDPVLSTLLALLCLTLLGMYFCRPIRFPVRRALGILIRREARIYWSPDRLQTARLFDEARRTYRHDMTRCFKSQCKKGQRQWSFALPRWIVMWKLKAAGFPPTKENFTKFAQLLLNNVLEDGYTDVEFTDDCAHLNSGIFPTAFLFTVNLSNLMEETEQANATVQA
jgi:hypothetical protein